jgi:hypothetical protein
MWLLSMKFEGELPQQCKKKLNKESQTIVRKSKKPSKKPNLINGQNIYY